MKTKILSVLCILFAVVCATSCSKSEDDSSREAVGDGLMATHTFYVTPDVLKFVDITLEYTDFEGNTVVEKMSDKSFKSEKEYTTSLLSASTAIKINIERNDVEIDPAGEYDVAVLYDFNAIRTFESGVGKAITTGRPIEAFTEKHTDIHKKYFETILGRLPKEVTCTHTFVDSPFGVQHFPEIEYGEE